MHMTPGRSISTLAFAVVSFAVLASATLAQDGRSFWPQQRPSPPPDLRSREPLAEDTEKEAIKLYAEARDALDTGDMEIGQRRLERLVGRYPDTVTASIARRDLKLLYSRGPETVSTSDRARPPAASIVRPEPLERPAAGPPAGAIVEPMAVSPAVTVQPGQTPIGNRLPQPQRPPRAPENSVAVDLANTDLRATAGDRLFFGDASDDLGGRAKNAIEAIAEWLRRHPAVDVAVEGHGDDRGNAEFNQAMATRRAEAVRARLIDLGIAPTRIAAIGLGRDKPVADCPEANCAAQNRRAVLVVTRVVGTFTGGDSPYRGDRHSTQPAQGGVTAVRR